MLRKYLKFFASFFYFFLKNKESYLKPPLNKTHPNKRKREFERDGKSLSN